MFEFWQVEILDLDGEWYQLDTGLTRAEAEKLVEHAALDGTRARASVDDFYAVPECSEVSP